MSSFASPNKFTDSQVNGLAKQGLSTRRLSTLRFALLLALLPVLLFVQASLAAQPGQITGQITGSIIGIVSRPAVNVRAGAGTNFDRIGKVTQGEKVEIRGRNAAGDWLHVCCVGNAQEGWIRGDLLTLQFPEGQSLNTLPVVESLTKVSNTNVSNTNVGETVVAAPAIVVAPPPTYPQSEGTNPLTGLGLPAGRLNQRPLIVCINNDYAARPQFGLSQADVVYEYLMEGYGITRFSAIFYAEEAERIGPVRSARIINHELATLYNGLTACSGASDAVRYMMKEQAPAPYVDFDLDDPSATRYVISVGRDYRTRMRTSSAMLRRYLADKSTEQAANLRGFTFGGLNRSGAPATAITIPYPRGVFVEYRYDAGSQRYLRWLVGAPHTDGNNGQQIAAENVIIQFVPHENTDIIEDSLGSRSIRLRLIGNGRSIVLRDGQAFEGTWRSDGGGDTPHFYDSSGNEVPLKPGRTWISVVPPTYTINFQ